MLMLQRAIGRRNNNEQGSVADDMAIKDLRKDWLDRSLAICTLGHINNAVMW